MSNVSPKEIVPQFKVPAQIAGIHRFDRGIINDTYIVTCIEEKEDKRFILQRINGEVFEKPDDVMSNIRVVTEHLRWLVWMAGPAEVPQLLPFGSPQPQEPSSPSLRSQMSELQAKVHRRKLPS